MQRQIVIFGGADVLARAGVWETNGTAAGTHELNGISGAFTLGVNPGFTVFNGEALFEEKDTNDNSNLWITDGSAAGGL